MTSAVQFNSDFEKVNKTFINMNKNSTLINEKSDMYDYLHKNKTKNLRKLDKLLNKKDAIYSSVFETPLHLIVLNTVNVIEHLTQNIIKNGVNITLTYNDKIYLGVAAGFLSILLLLFKI